MEPFAVSLSNRCLERHDSKPALLSPGFDRLTQNGRGGAAAKNKTVRSEPAEAWPESREIWNRSR